jgi:hypothetical protein
VSAVAESTAVMGSGAAGASVREHAAGRRKMIGNHAVRDMPQYRGHGQRGKRLDHIRMRATLTARRIRPRNASLARGPAQAPRYLRS